MKYSFRWPDNENGKEFSFRTNAFKGIFDVKVDEIEATKISDGVYQFYDKATDKKRKLEIINELMDNPMVNIDGKPLNLFVPTPMYLKFALFIPLLSFVWAKIFGIIPGIPVVILASYLSKRLNSTFLRIVVIGILGIGTFVRTYFLYQYCAANNWWGIIKTSSSSAA